MEEAIENTLQHYPNNKLAGAVLCSGIVMPPPSLKGYGPKGMLTSYSQFEHTLKVNLLGTYLVAQKVAERLIGNEPLDGERGVIITTSSITGLDGLITAYGTSKGNINGIG